MFGEERLKATLNTCKDRDPEEIIRRVKGAVNTFVKGAEQFDDLTMLCFRYNGPQD